MEFLVEFVFEVPAGTPDADVEWRQRAESAAAAKLAEDGHLVRLWRRPLAEDGTTAVGLYRADSQAELDRLLAALPLADWLRVTVTPLEAHPNDPTSRSTGGPMIILRQKMRAKHDRSDELMAALAKIVTPARATEGVISLDIGRVLLEPDSFIATVVYEDGAALERQESRPEVHTVMALLADSLAAPLERTIFDASPNEDPRAA